MGDIITAEEFDRIFDRIVWLKLLKEQVNNVDFLYNKFLCDWTYMVYYESDEYYILTDAYYNLNF